VAGLHYAYASPLPLRGNPSSSHASSPGDPEAVRASGASVPRTACLGAERGRAPSSQETGWVTRRTGARRMWSSCDRRLRCAGLPSRRTSHLARGLTDRSARNGYPNRWSGDRGA
jgi:hypothetical protein